MEHSPLDYIVVKGARLHNLKNLSVAIPRNQMTVVTGLSGSGKSSLVFDTLYAEGQRRYVESLSSYARQFLARMKKPEVDYIRGLAPAMAIDQKVSSSNPRSTVGATTEIYDYLKLLFARVGKTISPVSGQIVQKDTVDSVMDFLIGLPQGTRVEITSPLHIHEGKTIQDELKLLLQKGFSRIKLDGENHAIEEILDNGLKLSSDEVHYLLLVDRYSIDQENEEFVTRAADSIAQAFEEGHGICKIFASGSVHEFSDRFELDGLRFEEPTVNLFSFSNPFGACKTCEGFGTVIGIDEDLVIPDRNKSLYEGAIAPWKGEKMSEWLDDFIAATSRFDFPIHKPYLELSPQQKSLIWDGDKGVNGLHSFFRFLEESSYKIQYRVMLSRYRGRTVCPECKGTRLRGDANYVKLVDAQTADQKSITELLLMPVSKLNQFFKDWTPAENDQKIADRLLAEIGSRLGFLCDVGLGYLTLNRQSASLSGGESQRIRLATSLGSNLVGSLYILDEPSIGLHPRDTQRLVSVLENLRNKGNTVVVVEHEEAVMRAADHILDIGPEAGQNGGNLIFSGSFADLEKSSDGLTGKYLRGDMRIPKPDVRRKWNRSIAIHGAFENNLQNVDVDFPLNTLTVVTGVSGSGKTSLVKKVLYPALKKLFGGFNEASGKFVKIAGDYHKLKDVEMIDQNPIGKSSRSNPVTYTKAYDYIRKLFEDQPMSVARGYKAKHFSFNVEGGRCETCQGEGQVTIEMQFLADITVECDECFGKRFKNNVLEITYKDKSISDVLEMTVDEGVEFFKEEKNILQRLLPLQQVGLGYVQLGQASSTLSGGEAQRIKLAYYLIKGNSAENMLFIFDEPTTGLHFHDIQKLMVSINALIDQGNSVIIIEHNPEVIRCADWVIDLGPEGGDEGGKIVFTGTPEDLIHCSESYTGKFLRL